MTQFSSLGVALDSGFVTPNFIPSVLEERPL